jgi:hypothetical protein
LQAHRLATNVHFSFIRLERPEEHPHQRGFARTVFADEGVNPALLGAEIYIFNGSK